jgi:hypothetical protein
MKDLRRFKTPITNKFEEPCHPTRHSGSEPCLGNVKNKQIEQRELTEVHQGHMP